MLALKTTEVRSRIEPEMKDDATKVLADCGLNLSDAIRLFLRQVVAHRGLPFDVKLPTAATLAAMDEARGMSQARFRSAQDLFDEIEGKTAGRKARQPRAKSRPHQPIR